MSFTQRQINVQFDLAQDSFPGGSKTLALNGYRILATIATSIQGPLATYSLSLRIFGMKMADMNLLSLAYSKGVVFRTNQVQVFAGDVGGLQHTVFAGTIYGAFIDISDSAEASFVVSAQGGLFERANSAAANTYPGTQDVASIIGGLAAQMGMGFQNHGVTAKLSGQYLSGTLMDQIERVATAAQTVVLLDNNVFHIWPNRDAPNFPEINLSSASGMASYPKFEECGICVRAEWNPLFLYGTVVNITSSIPRASGAWQLTQVTHDLSTLMPDGPWFSELHLFSLGFSNVRSN